MPVFRLLNVVYLRSLLPIYSILILTRPEINPIKINGENINSQLR